MTMIATQEGVRGEHVVVPFTEEEARQGEAARLSFDNGLSRLDLRADPALELLLDARFGDPTPVVWAARHSVHVEYPLGARLLHRMRPNAMRISPRVPWSIDVHGGAQHFDADLAGVDLRSIAVHAGAAHTRLVLGRPAGLCTIRFASVKDLRVERPGDVPVRLEVAKAVTNVTLDDRRFGAVGGGLADQTSGYDAARPGYLLIVSGAADTIAIA